jgi:hypothetical protein
MKIPLTFGARRTRCAPLTTRLRRQEVSYAGVAADGELHLVLHARVICKGRLTREEILFGLKHCWRFVNLEPLELQALS